MSRPAEAMQHFTALAEQAAGRCAPLAPTWINQRRAAARARLQGLEFPTRKQEAWRYTSLDRLLSARFAVADDSRRTPVDSHFRSLQIAAKPAARLVFCDGRYLAAQSHVDERATGLKVKSLGSLHAGEMQRLAAHLGSILGEPEAVFETINTALMADGFFIEVEADTLLEGPIEVVHTSSPGDQALLLATRNLVLMRPGSRAMLIEHFSSETEAANFSSSVTELALEANAGLAHYRLQDEAANSIHKSTVAVKQAGGSEYQGVAVSLGGQWSRTDYRVAFSGENAACQLKGLYITGRDQLSDFHVDIDHAVPACHSDEHFKGILLGQSRAVFDGRVKVAVDAQKTTAHLKNDNLLLSRRAEIDTKPVLEIFADDVQCSHGTTVGQIEDEQLFYLRSRGIDTALAQRLLCSGFAQELLDECRLPEFRDYAEKAMHAYL